MGRHHPGIGVQAMTVMCGFSTDPHENSLHKQAFKILALIGGTRRLILYMYLRINTNVFFTVESFKNLLAYKEPLPGHPPASSASSGVRGELLE